MATEKRLIDTNKLNVCYINTGTVMFPKMEAYVRADDIANAPIVDAAEVVHAEWLDIRFDSMWRSMLATCSHCKVRGEVRVKSNECGFAVPDSDYCPHCGAKMDGGV